MATAKQELGAWGEQLIVSRCVCPQCKRSKTLKRLPSNFKCADLICDFCGYLAQVKAATVASHSKVPKQILGAAWGAQKERMDAVIYFPLFLVLKSPIGFAIYYLPTDFQNEDLFVPRKPLSSEAKRAGWQGFMYNLSAIPEGSLVKLSEFPLPKLIGY